MTNLSYLIAEFGVYGLLTPLDDQGTWTALSGRSTAKWLASASSVDGVGSTPNEAKTNLLLKLRERNGRRPTVR